MLKQQPNSSNLSKAISCVSYAHHAWIDKKASQIRMSFNRNVLDLFRHWVAVHPDDKAIIVSNQCLTFKTLDELSNQLARYLLDNGISKA